MLKQMDAFESQLTHTYSRKLRGGPEGPESLLSEDKPARCITPSSLRKKRTHSHTLQTQAGLTVCWVSQYG